MIAGIISDPNDATANPASSSSNLLSFVSTAWDNLRYAKSLTGIDFQFVRINRRDDMTMDTLIEGKYTNQSADASFYLPVCLFIRKFAADRQ